jgi:hypothetical protein
MQEQVDAIQRRPFTRVFSAYSSEGKVMLLKSIADESCI